MSEPTVDIFEGWSEDPNWQDDWFPDFPGDTQSKAAFCDTYEAHEAHNYRAVNHNYYNCPGLTAEDLIELESRADELCEHGMSADLCAGPMHYPA